MTKPLTIDLNLLDQQIIYLSTLSFETQEEQDYQEGLLNFLCDLYSRLNDEEEVLIKI